MEQFYSAMAAGLRQLGDTLVPPSAASGPTSNGSRYAVARTGRDTPEEQAQKGYKHDLTYCTNCTICTIVTPRTLGETVMAKEPRVDPTEHLVADAYVAVGVSDARNELGQLCDKVAHGEKRILLKKHDRAMAALVPVSDLRTLHALDLATSEDLVAEADREQLDLDGTVDLAEANRPPRQVGLHVTSERRPLAGGEFMLRLVAGASMSDLLVEQIVMCVSAAFPMLSHETDSPDDRLFEAVKCGIAGPLNAGASASE